jgi:hypothetical protein
MTRATNGCSETAVPACSFGVASVFVMISEFSRIETAWNGVSINWDDGRTSSIENNDMARIQRVKQKGP